MPQYFFTRTDGVFVDPDYQGLLLAGPEEAKLEAVSFARDSLNWDQYDPLSDGELRIEVKDDLQRVVFTVRIITMSVTIKEEAGNSS